MDSRHRGDPVVINNFEDDDFEAIFISRKIRELENDSVKLSQIAILTRASFQFKDIEDRFLKENIKYKVVGGLRFYERSEIKDAIAYIKLLVNRSDNLSLERILNVPKRGLGKAIVKKLYEIVNSEGLSLFESLKECMNLEN